MLDTLHSQLYDVDMHIGNLEFNEFAMENRFAQEDEQAALEDQARQQGWFDEVKADIEAIEQELEDLKVNGEIPADSEQEAGALRQQLEGLVQERDGIQEQIDAFAAEMKRQQEAQEQKERERAEAAEKARKEQEAEQAERDRTNLKKDLERTRAEINHVNETIEGWKKEIEEKRGMQKEATDGKQFQQLDSQIRELQGKIEEAIDMREFQLKPFLDDVKYQQEELKRQDEERKAEEQAEQRRKDEEKVAKLADDEEVLADKKADMEEAKALMDRYTAIYDAEGNLDESKIDDLPWDWTEELQTQYEEEFYAAKDVYQKMN